MQVAQAAQSAADREHALDHALQGCQRASHLIAQLLTLARLESSAATNFESCDLRQIAQQQISELALNAWEQGVQLALAEGDSVPIQGLATLLEVLLRNLLDNAIRYTGAGTEVVVTAAYAENRAYLAVVDNGRGLAAEELAKITERFYRPADTTATGSGLGLSIVQRIVELHAGSLQITQAANGRGLSVFIYFPPAT